MWTYDDGAVRAGDSVAASVADATPADPLLPVAVVTSGLTMSSGEAVAVAFRGRAGSRSFGEPTYGVPTSNRTVPLADGATLLLTVAHFADRTGRTYEEPLVPDESVVLRWEAFGTVQDPALQDASDWLLGHPGCSS